MKHTQKALGLYIHIPFCIRKCSYCDFLSAPAPEAGRQAYIRQLLNEITESSIIYRDYEITTLFIGGGTPSILEPRQMTAVIRRLRDCFFIRSDAEITVECNPGTLDEEKLSAYRACGINRLSIGLQSADAQELRLLGRIHTYAQFAQNYELARRMGFENINIDLMSALPGQSIGTYEHTLETVLALRPEHISAYSLLIEEGTPFYARYHQAELLREKGKPQSLLPAEEEERRMYVLTKERLKRAGYHRYEISNYARDGYACRHNTGYWTRENYLGLGLGAASFIGNVRFSNTADLGRYLAFDFASFRGAASRSGAYAQACPGWQAQAQQLDEEAQMEEFMFLGLRMMRGVSAQRFYEQFSVGMEDIYGDVLEKQLKEHLIKKTETGYCLTEFGIDVSNYVMAQYLHS